jgi:predicted dienelactone hydrolase
MVVMYPCHGVEQHEALGPFSLSVARDSAPLEGPWPLVLLSHGSGGSPLTHRDLARHLAARGFVVGLPEHPFNNRRDNSLAEHPELVRLRVADLRLAAAWFFEHGPFVRFVRPGAYSVIGHSIGAATALAIAGGEPTSLPHQSVDRQAKQFAVDVDARVRSLVLLAPATVWFRRPAALRNVTAPVLMVASYHDHAAPYFYFCQHVLDGVPDVSRVRFHLVEQAGHYSFLSPWPEAMKHPAFAPSQDPPGFDRPAFLEWLFAEVTTFLASSA